MQHPVSRRAMIKTVLRTSAYAAPAIVAVTVPERAAAASPLPPSADLGVTKTVDNAAPIVNTNVTFSLIVRNNGPDAAANVTATDVLPAGLTFVSSTPSAGVYSSPAGVWTIGTLAAGQAVTLSLVATAAGPVGTPRTNTVTVTSATADPALGNNSASATVTPQAAPTADIAITKTVNNATPIVGTNVTFTVTAKNNGPNAATGVAVTDALPAGLTFVSGTPSAGTYTSATGAWTIGALAVGQTVTLSLVATAAGPAGTARTNTATLTASSPTDPNAANNSASAAVTPQPLTADIAVTKTVDNPTPIVEGQITFTTTVKNNGPNAASGVVVSDPVPGAPFFFNSATASQGTYVSATGVWTIGSLAVGQSVTLTMTGLVGGTPVTNTATLTASSPTDPNGANNSASATATPQFPM